MQNKKAKINRYKFRNSTKNLKAFSKKLMKNTSLQKNRHSKLKNNFNNKNLLSKLKIRLKNAVKNEKYEIAAEIRDKIKKIES